MRKVIKKELVRVDDSPAAMPAGYLEPTEPVNCQPELRVIRTDGRVAAIEYTCSCGERAHFELEYGELEAATDTNVSTAAEATDLDEEPLPPQEAA